MDRIFDYLLAQPDVPQLVGLSGERIAALKGAVREEFKGQRVYVATHSETARAAMAQRVLALFNGRNATEVARELGISRPTVYRMLKQPGRQSGRNEWVDYGESAADA